MDARINFANARVLKEFCLRAMRLRANKGEKIDYLVLDCQPTNDVDMTGAEMLEVLAQTCESQNTRLILTNLKGPVGKVLQRCDVPRGIRAHGGHTCIDMKETLAIIAQEDPAGQLASETFREFVKNVDEARVQLKSAKGSSLPFQCGGQKAGIAAATNLDTGSPRKILQTPEARPCGNSEDAEKGQVGVDDGSPHGGL
jgi:anti-anti-sigma regulatory factor